MFALFRICHPRPPRRLAAWLALAAALSLALVPTLSRALAAAAGPGAAVCRSAPGPMSAPVPATHFEACALCVLCGLDAPLPPARSALQLQRPPAGSMPVPAASMRASAPDRRHAPARAPPASA